MLTINRKTAAATGGRVRARRFLFAGIVAAVFAAGAAAAAANAEIAVREKDGVYDVRAAFTVTRPASVVMTVLTDYVQIPRYMPEVRTSQLLERRDDRAVVEQEAVARFLMFSKRIHLVLDVQEAPLTLAFRDRCGKSFEQYDGAWSMIEKGGETRVAYRLTAKPAFDVPDWLLARLLKRDATNMIERLQTEIAAR